MLKQQVVNELSYSLPNPYLDLLKIADGIDCNGFQLYSGKTQKMLGFEDREGYLILSLVEANAIWREHEPNNQYIFFAESGDVLYCHNLTNNRFEIVDRLTKELTYEPSSFETCDELLQQLLNHMLDRYGEEIEEAE